MFATHNIKINGVWHRAGSDIPAFAADVEEQENQHTKTEINRMTTAELRKFAKENRVDNAEKMTGSELKKVLIKKLGL